MNTAALERQWRAVAAAAGLTGRQADSAFLDLCARYSEPGRAYHTLGHVADVLDTVSQFRDGVQNDTALRLAVWFHDAVYDARRADNEEQSAAYAAAMLREGRAAPALLPVVEGLILATKAHRALPDDSDCQLLLDADLAILGASPAEHDRYASAIRSEYAWVPEPDYRRGRQRVLTGFLERERLYRTPLLFQQCERAARENLRREIDRLTDPQAP